MLSRLQHLARVAAVATVAVLSVMALSAPADATTLTYINGPTSGAFGPRHTLTYNTSYSGGGYGVCANAMNDTGTSWVGQTQCNSVLISIAYCQCAVRYPWGGPQSVPGLNMMAWEDY